MIPWISLLAGSLLSTWAGEKSETLGGWLLLTSALAFGLPHGAYDFWILSDNTQNKSNKARSLVKSLFSYLALVIVTLAIWYFLPSLALLGFLALTAWHFGSGDAIWERDLEHNWLTSSLGRGLLVLSAPLAFYPNESGAVLAKLDSNSVGTLITIAPYVLVIGIFFFLLDNVLLISRNSKIDLSRESFVWLETLILLIFFWLTTPLLAITIYLVGVHSWRHLLRLNVYEQDGKMGEFDGVWQNIKRFHQRSLPMTILSLIGLALIFLIWPFRISDLSDKTSAFLVLLSVLTVPHAMLITWTELKLSKQQRFSNT